MNAVLLIGALFGAYLIDCAIWPYLFCLYCGGSKRKVSPISRGFRFCPTCGGKGVRRRFGKVLLDLGRKRR